MSAIASVDAAIRDFEECKRLGMVGIMMPGNASFADYDHLDYDALWACAAELELPLCFHVLSSREPSGGDRPARGHPINSYLGIVRAVQDILGMLVLAGVFERHPTLAVVCAEGDAGWLPHYLQRIDHAARDHAEDGILPGLSKPPSEYLRSNVWMTFQDDWVAFKTLDLMSGSQLLWANERRCFGCRSIEAGARPFSRAPVTSIPSRARSIPARTPALPALRVDSRAQRPAAQ